MNTICNFAAKTINVRHMRCQQNSGIREVKTIIFRHIDSQICVKDVKQPFLFTMPVERIIYHSCLSLCLYHIRQYYPDPHPVHGVQLMRVGKLQHYLAHIEDALDTFKQVCGIKY